MGCDINLRIVIKDFYGVYHNIKFYKKNDNNEYKLIDFFPDRNYELFDILTGREDEFFPKHSVYDRDLPEDLKEELIKTKTKYGYNYCEVNFSDLILYLTKHPKVRDWNYDDDSPKAWKPNPVKKIANTISAIAYLTDIDFYFDSDIRIIYWFN